MLAHPNTAQALRGLRTAALALLLGLGCCALAGSSQAWSQAQAESGPGLCARCADASASWWCGGQAGSCCGSLFGGVGVNSTRRLAASVAATVHKGVGPLTVEKAVRAIVIATAQDLPGRSIAHVCVEGFEGLPSRVVGDAALVVGALRVVASPLHRAPRVVGVAAPVAGVPVDESGHASLRDDEPEKGQDYTHSGDVWLRIAGAPGVSVAQVPQLCGCTVVLGLDDRHRQGLGRSDAAIVCAAGSGSGRARSGAQRWCLCGAWLKLPLVARVPRPRARA